MRVLINDHAGHPFQVQLSRSLAQRGHTVLHTYCALLQTPRGTLSVKDFDPDTFDVEGVYLDKEFSRYGLFIRYQQEKRLGKLLVEKIGRFSPDVVISANTPLGTQAAIIHKCKAANIKFIYWVQDLLGVGIHKNVRKKIPVIGSVIGHYYMRLERSLLRKSDEAVVITEDFCPIMDKAGVPNNRLHVIHNWAPLEEVQILSKSNPWSQEQGLDHKFCFVYTGTLGMKHNPDLLIKLALNFKEEHDARIIIVTEGLGADFLKDKKKSLNLDNLILMPFQPFEVLPMVLASADVLIAILEPDAGVFAVPSKVLTYLCSQRPLLLAVPPENLAARIVKDNNVGIVVPPSETEQFVDAAMTLMNDQGLRNSLAENGRAYAVETFDIDKITDRFEEIIMR